MWKRGGRSSALDRAQALLSAKRSSGGDVESLRGSTATTRAHTNAVATSVTTRSAGFSDLSDLSSISPTPENTADHVNSAAPERSRRIEQILNEDLRPQSSLGGGGSRFLKKAPPATISSHSPVSKSQTQHVHEPRYVSSSQHGTLAAAMSRLAQIESRVRSREQAVERPGHRILSPPEAASQSPEASTLSGSNQNPSGKRFLKNKAAVAVDSVNTAASGSSKGPDVGVRPKSRAAGTLEIKSLRVANGVSLESDEEDMRRLLRDSLDSTDESILRARRLSSVRTADKKVHSTPPPAIRSSSPSDSVPMCSSASPSRRSSPFRFTGKAQPHFSPSALSPCPSPPHDSPSPQRGLDSPHSQRRSLSAMSGCSEVLSLEELFPVRSGCEDIQRETSLVPSDDGHQDFKINVMTLDDLVPATFGFTEETRTEREAEDQGPRSTDRDEQLPRLKEEHEEEEDAQDYQSDFESGSWTEPVYSGSQVSEHLPGDRDDVDVVSETREEASKSDVSCERTEEDYSDTFSDTASQLSDHSQTSESLSRNRNSVSHGSWSSCQQERKCPSARNALKEAAVQTHPHTTAFTWSTGLTYMNPAAAHTLSADAVEALSTFNPAGFALIEMLKQQLTLTRHFIESRRQLHSSQVRCLEPPNYKYTTLEDTKKYIHKHRPTLSMEEHEKDSHCL